MTTISASTTAGIYLASPAYRDPIVIDQGVAVTGNYRGYAIYAYAGTWDITNSGTVAGSDASVGGIHLGAGGGVTNENGAVIGAPFSDPGAIYITGGAGTVSNAGIVNAGIWLEAGGTVTNQASGTITSESTSGGYGIGLHADGMVTNAGTVSGVLLGVGLDVGGTLANQAGTISGQYIGVLSGILSGTPGVATGGGGDIANAAGATISGAVGIMAGGAAATVVNAGDVVGTSAGTSAKGPITLVTGAGVSMSGGGAVTNQAGGSIVGASFGVYIGGGAGTVVDAGSIVGGNGTAVAFGGTGGNLLALDPGFGLSGLAIGSPSASNTLELASAASAGTLSGLGSAYRNFTQTTIDIGATWTLSGNNTIDAGQTMTNSGSLKLLAGYLYANGPFVNNGIVSADPSSLTATNIGGTGTIEIGADSTVTANGTVSAGQTIVFTGTNAVLNVPHSGHFAGTIMDQGPSDQVNLACFAAGTRLLTRSGEAAVETLAPGERLMTRSGRLRPAIWIGHRQVDCTRHPKPLDVWPVRVRTGAFGGGMPHRDLFLSPDHAVFIDGALIPIRHLINGRTIVQERVDTVTYYHVELSAHDVILAEGLPCESYLDTGNRAAFEEGKQGGALPRTPPGAEPLDLNDWVSKGPRPLAGPGQSPGLAYL